MAFRGHALERAYHFEYALGLWPFGSVQVIRERQSDALKLCKTVQKDSLRNPADAVARLQRLRDLQHAHICGITAVEEDRSCIYVISDQQSGGDVSEFLVRLQEDGNWLLEQTVAEYVRQMLIAFAHAHGARASHRDLRPSSVVLSSRLPDAKVLVTDIGIADILDPTGSVLCSASNPYAPPELRSGVAPPWDSADSAAADIWSIGAIAHQLLAGAPPPRDEPSSGPWSVLSRGGALCHEAADSWSSRSDLSREFVQHLLRPRASSRPTAAAALQHQWICACCPLDPERWPAGSEVEARLLCFVLAVLMLPAVAQYRDLFQLRSTFVSSDADRDGFLPSAVAHRLLKERGALPSDAAAALDAVDVRRTGTVSLCALWAAWFITEGFCRAEGDESRLRQPRDLSRRLLRGFFQVFGDAQRGVASASGVSERHAAVVAREMEMHAGVRYEELLACLPEEEGFGAEALAAAIGTARGRGTPVADVSSAEAEDSDHSWGDGLSLDRVGDAVQSVFRSCGLAGSRGRCDSGCDAVDPVAPAAGRSVMRRFDAPSLGGL